MITSAPGGGPWTSGSSWVGGSVPTAVEDVVIASPIAVPGTVQCNALTVTSEGTLSSSTSASGTVITTASVVNQGTIQDTTTSLHLEVGGNLSNAGDWSCNQTTLGSTGEVHLDMAIVAQFTSKLVRSSGATGDVIVDTPFHITGGIDLQGGRMVLGPGSDLTLDFGAFEDGELLCNGNRFMLDTAYLTHCTVDGALFDGTVTVSALVEFTGGATVLGTLQNFRSTGSSHVKISGGLVNRGLIRDDNYGFTIDLAGDLTNDGVISNSWLAFDGASDHHLRMGPEGVIAADVFLPEFQGGVILAESDLHIQGDISLGSGTLILAPGSRVRLTRFGSIWDGEIQANGSTTVMGGPGVLSDLVIDSAVLAGRTQVAGNSVLTGDVKVIGVLQNREYNNVTLHVEGNLTNEGVIRDAGVPFEILARGAVVNLGAMTNSRLVMDGSADQLLGVPSPVQVPDLALESHLVAATYQWFRNGEPLAGETGPTLTFVGIDGSDGGVYHCEGDGGQASRAFTVNPLVPYRSLLRPQPDPKARRLGVRY